MEKKLDIVEKSNKTLPIIVGILGVLYGISPVDAIPDVIPIAGWVDDLGVTGGAILHVIQAFTNDTNTSLAKIIGILKWMLWILGGILILVLGLLGITIYNLFK
ncbi:YkvA family protein [Chryseobacterium luquanense]|uniref:DUF1232 domain-containing protein n=1 Tax=Chryseobacterium luquanense TaxID=2983766 RepID=A0ABT3Y6P4_9FLAO|nr:DUF1232 domain-containing protein [Chryseobacterium luquanense]MCX8533831.1 DUF1232 domain-containing protein [Chryseobacterium luquanense]